jgi:hypothetical protein
MVQQWGAGRAEKDRKLTEGAAIRKCWGELNAAFGVSTYTDLPAARYDEILRYIKDRYRGVRRRSRFWKRVVRPSKRSGIIPSGPLRCLSTCSSTSPLFAVSLS